jgi:cyclic beta-1,2-glucan synthetase
LVTSAGGGYSRWREVDLTRWRADTTQNDWGTWIYVQDMESGALWSAGIQPAGVAPQSRDVFFNAHMAQFRRRDHDISLSMEVTVPPDDDVEVRRVTMTNHSDGPRRLRLTSCAEVVLAAQSADARHPAFNKLFIESEVLPDGKTLLFRRRPRSETEEPVFLSHFVIVEGGLPRGADRHSYETDRLRFLGRGRTARAPLALSAPAKGGGLTRTVGATLDPIMAVSQEVVLDPHGSLQLAFVTAAGSSRQEVLDLSGRYGAWGALNRAFDQARAHAEVELRQLGIKTDQLRLIQELLSLLIYPHSALRPDASVLATNRKGQPGLWAFGISGDYPILLVRVSRAEDLSLVYELLQAHIYWRKRKLMIDLVILNTKGTGYEQELNNQIRRLLVRADSEGWLNRRGGIYLLVADQMGEQDRILLETAARVVLDGDRGSLAEQLGRSEGVNRLPPRLPPFTPLPPDSQEGDLTLSLPSPSGLLFDNGLGGFSADGREYLIYLKPGRWTPAPWVNVIANPDFGFLVSESGGGFSWSLNSGENRLTPWSNDPVSDPPGEAIYLRDEETAEIWSPTPLPARAAAPYLVRHGAGYTTFEHQSHGLDQRLRMFVAPDDPVKILHLRLENRWTRPRRITVTCYAEWVLGVNREMSQQYIIPEYDGDSQALLARNPYNPEFGERVAFVAASKPLHGLTADRTEFLGRFGSRSRPAALRRIGLSGAVAAGLDPCAALMLHVDLQPGEVEEVYFLLGQGADRDEAVRLVRQYQDAAQVAAAWEGEVKFWDEFLGAVVVKTPEPGMDLLLNRWLLYQSLACRIWGRSAFYQSSGAYGFRDQLQDVMSLLYAAPSLARQHLLRAAERQFEAGDVLHWWHPPSGRGVRTRFSDDLLWLPYVTAEYIFATGDDAVLQEKAPFLRAPQLEPKEDERYGFYPDTPEAFSLYEHCRRALERGATSGPHNLPLMGSGDWNDGMNRVGIGGRGESIWLGWFLYDTLLRFADLCDRRGDRDLAAW